YGGIQQNALQSTLFYKGYLVDRDGDLNLPLIGKTKAEGRTILELETLLTEKLKEFYKYPFVSVKFASFQVTVLGEVAMPGVHQVYNKHLNLFQAVAMAGDMTSLANRNKVRIIREYGDKTETHYLDFTAPDLIDSEFYFLQPNDVIYVEPSRLKAFNVNTRITNVILSLVSIGLVVVNLTTR
ncbi:MAG: polysaccharide biosynthesis/export family protein, partial [Flavobacteriales bacterium]|nr:polysaccharide biosynthesis/export family protein [Flavobacteriales bacterium]